MHSIITTMEKNEVLSMLSCNVDSNLKFNMNESSTSISGGVKTNSYIPEKTTTCWTWWQNYYYPTIITNWYPVYVRERALDKGKQAYEIIKLLKDKKLIEVSTVKKFMELMDALINIV
jgi:hypothetical protein